MHENMLCNNVADMVLCGNNVFIYNCTQYLWATGDQELLYFYYVAHKSRVSIHKCQRQDDWNGGDELLCFICGCFYLIKKI